jgi:hypothetical protein
MGSQSFRGAGGVGAITVRPIRTHETAEHELHPRARELTARRQRAEHAPGPTAAVVVTALPVTGWLCG